MIESLIGVIEFLIQGSLAAAVALYFAAFFHPVPERLREYLADLRETLSGQDTPFVSIRALVVTLVCASLYFLGVMTNVVNYWVLAPVHNSVIQDVRQEVRKEVCNDSATPEIKQKVCDRPFDSNYVRRGDAAFLAQAFPQLLTRNDQSRRYYGEYLTDDATWRNKKLEAHESVLPFLRKHLRIVRGVAVAAYVVFYIAFLKSLMGLLIAIVSKPWNWKGHPNSVAMWLYRHFVSYSAYQESNADDKVGEVVSETLRGMVAPNLILAILGVAVFSVALLSYRTIEQEYQLLVMFGALKAA